MVLANVVKFSENEMTFFAGSTNTDVSMQLIAERFSVPLLLVTMGKLESKPVLTAGSTLIQHVQLTVSTPPVREMLLSPGYYGNWHSTVYQKTNHNSQLTTHLITAQLCGALATTEKGARTSLQYRHQLEELLD